MIAKRDRDQARVDARGHDQCGSAMVDDWLIALPHSGTTKNNYRRLLGVLFNFAIDRKYVLQIPISKQSKSSVKRAKSLPRLQILTRRRTCGRRKGRSRRHVETPKCHEGPVAGD